jgi:hypothetical protein
MGRIYKSSKKCTMWLGEVEEEPIEPFRRLESPDPVELKIMEGLIRDLTLTTPEPLRMLEKKNLPLTNLEPLK